MRENLSNIKEILITPGESQATFLYKDGHIEVAQVEELTYSNWPNSTGRDVRPVQIWKTHAITWQEDRKVATT